MCSVVGYIGNGCSRSFVMEGLRRLEYRGYDSAGFACLNVNDNRLVYAKAIGRLPNLLKLLDSSPINGHLGIGHTRWSTHGIASQENAHPHFDCKKTISIVHNGIIENHHEIKKQLKKFKLNLNDMSYYKKKQDKTVLNMVLMVIAGFAASGFAAWAIVEFILYLVKDNPFNYASLWLMGIAIVLEVIFFVKNIVSD